MKRPKPKKGVAPDMTPSWTESEAQAMVDAFFKDRDERKLPYTITGLALALDSDRFTLYKYRSGQRGDGTELGHIIKKAVDRCVEWWESRIASQAAGGPIFWLKNHEWHDLQEVKSVITEAKVDLGKAAPIVRKFEQELKKQLEASIKKAK